MTYQDDIPVKGFISTQLHGVLDYLVGLLLIASPWLFHFYMIDSAAAVFVPIFFGWLTLIMALFTRYEASPIKMFPLQLHLILDGFAGFVLIVLPFLYGFYHLVVWPHLLIGLLMFGSALFTRHSPFFNRFETLDSRGL